MQDLITTARVVERVPENHPKWLRVEVEWSADVQALLDAHLLHLDPPAAAPVWPSREERLRGYWRDYHARHREERNKARRDARRKAKELNEL